MTASLLLIRNPKLEWLGLAQAQGRAAGTCMQVSRPPSQAFAPWAMHGPCPGAPPTSLGLCASPPLPGGLQAPEWPVSGVGPLTMSPSLTKVLPKFRKTVLPRAVKPWSRRLVAGSPGNSCGCSGDQHDSLARTIEMLIPGGPGPPAPGHVTAENELFQASSLIMRERCSALSTLEENWHKRKCLT